MISPKRNWRSGYYRCRARCSSCRSTQRITKIKKMRSTGVDQPTLTDSKIMSTTQQVLAEFHETRLKQKAEEARWEHYRREANPPWSLVIALVLVGFAGMVTLAAYLLANPNAFRSPFGLLIVPIAGVLQLVVKLAQRREKALVLAIKEEAPELFAKLKDEQLVR